MKSPIKEIVCKVCGSRRRVLEPPTVGDLQCGVCNHILNSKTKREIRKLKRNPNRRKKHLREASQGGDRNNGFRYLQLLHGGAKKDA